MPSKSGKQARFMKMACAGKARKKISRRVACEFAAADSRKAKKRRKKK